MTEVDQKVASPGGRYRSNEPAVVADIIDGEVVIMNLERGSYYSINQSGANVWRLLISGAPVAKISAAMAAHFDVPTAQVELDIGRLVCRLVEEGVIVPIKDDAADQTITPAPFSLASYVPPVMEVYSDMKDLSRSIRPCRSKPTANA